MQILGGLILLGQLTLHHCTIDYLQSTLVGSSEAGVLQESFVQIGDVVSSGQDLATLRDGEAKAHLDLCRLEASSDLDLKLHVAQLRQAINRQKISYSLRKREAISEEQYVADQIAAELAAIEVERAKERRSVSQAKLAEAMAKFKAKRVICPHSGVIGEVLKLPGESVSPGTPVFRVDGVERLKVVGKVDVGDINKIRCGDKVDVHVELDGVDLPIEQQRFAGRIEFVDPKIDRDTQLCTVIAVVENNDRVVVAGLAGVMHVEH